MKTLGAIPPNQKDILKRAGGYRMRKANATVSSAPLPAARKVNGKFVRGDGRGKPFFRPNKDLPENTQRALGGYMANGSVVERENGQTGTSIFDPVLCELVYRWFCPSGGAILDPFAGGSVRGIVAAYLGYQYVGVDLSERQIKANRIQAKNILSDVMPAWVVGDSRNISVLAKAKYDLIFSCPPYFDLEVYSDDKNDLSTMAWKDFLQAYKEIIGKSCSMLKGNRFACFVVGDIRDKNGFYRNFVGETINAFQDAGLILYNDAMLVTAIGSLPIRIGRQFSSYRKLGKTHQNVLVFYNGSPKDIKQEFGEVLIDENLFESASNQNF